MKIIRSLVCSALFGVVLAACGGADPSDESGDNADSTDEALRKEGTGACIRIGVSTHTFLTGPDNFHGYLRQTTSRSVSTSLNLQTADYPNGPVKHQEVKSGTNDIDINIDWHFHKCARVYAKDPCSGKFVGSPWACF